MTLETLKTLLKNWKEVCKKEGLSRLKYLEEVEYFIDLYLEDK